MTLRTLAGRFLLLPIAVENLIVLTIALAGTMTWITGELFEVGSSDPFEAFLISSLTFVHRVTLTFLVFGGIAWGLRWIRNRALSVPLGAKEESHQPWLFSVILILASNGALSIVFARPLPLLLQDGTRLLQSWGVWEGIRRGDALSGVYLVPVLGILMVPGLAIMTAVAFIGGAFATLGYLLLGLEDSLRVLFRSMCLQIALLLSLFFALDLLDTVMRIVDGGFTEPDAMELRVRVLPWLTRQADQLAPMARHFAWLLPGFFFCAAIAFRKGRAGESEDQQGTGTSQFLGKTPAPEPAPMEWAGDLLETDERFRHSRYLIRLKFLSNPFYKTFEVFDSDNQLIFVAQMNGLSLFTRVIRVKGSAREQGETLCIVGRRFLRFPDLFDLTYCPTNSKKGTFKNSRTGWLILDESGREIAAMKMERVTWGAGQGRLLADGSAVCRYTFQNILRPVFLIHFPEDSAQGFDRKLAIGLALVICFQSVAFNYPYSDHR